MYMYILHYLLRSESDIILLCDVPELRVYRIYIIILLYRLLYTIHIDTTLSNTYIMIL